MSTIAIAGWNRLEVANSSNIQRIEYCPTTHEMLVYFKSGKMWLYKNVLEIHFDALKECNEPNAAFSVGKYFASIKSSLTGAEFTGDRTECTATANTQPPT